MACPKLPNRPDDEDVEIDPAVVLLAHVLPRRLGDVEGAAQVDIDDRVEQLGVHVGERLVAQDPGVVDHDVDATEGVDGGLHDRRAALGRRHRVGVGDRLAAGRGDLVDDQLGGADVGAGAIDGAAEVVDDDEGAPRGEKQGVLLAESAAGTGDDRNLAVETELSHESRNLSSLSGRCRIGANVAPSA